DDLQDHALPVIFHLQILLAAFFVQRSHRSSAPTAAPAARCAWTGGPGSCRRPSGRRPGSRPRTDTPACGRCAPARWSACAPARGHRTKSACCGCRWDRPPWSGPPAPPPAPRRTGSRPWT
ncbi:DNA-binding protein, partial [Dysosmobacter welbionis]